MKSAYAINKLRKKTGYTKNSFYQQAVRLYKEVRSILFLLLWSFVGLFTWMWGWLLYEVVTTFEAIISLSF